MTITKAKVQVTLEIEVPDTWGDDCSLSQVYKQAGESANGLLTKWINDRKLRASVIGKPIVTAITSRQER